MLLDGWTSVFLRLISDGQKLTVVVPFTYIRSWVTKDENTATELSSPIFSAAMVLVGLKNSRRQPGVFSFVGWLRVMKLLLGVDILYRKFSIIDVCVISLGMYGVTQWALRWVGIYHEIAVQRIFHHSSSRLLELIGWVLWSTTTPRIFGSADFIPANSFFNISKLTLF